MGVIQTLKNKIVCNNLGRIFCESSTPAASIVTDGLVYGFDAGNYTSDPIEDLSTNNLTTTRLGSYSSNSGGYFLGDTTGGTNGSPAPMVYVDWAAVLDVGETFTIQFMTKPDDPAGVHHYFSYMSLDNSALIYNLSSSGAFQIYAGGYTRDVPVTAGSWVNIAYTKGANGVSNNLKAYKDGEYYSQESKDFTVPDAGGGFYRIGGFCRDNAYTGAVSMWLLYDRALTAEEVQQNYDYLKDRYLA